MNQLLCWQTLLERGPLSTALLAVLTGIHLTYVKTIVRDLRCCGCIETSGPVNARVHSALVEPQDRRGRATGSAKGRRVGQQVYATKARYEYAVKHGERLVTTCELERCWPIPIPAKTGTGVSHD